MELSALKLQENELGALSKKFNSVEDIAYCFPRKYIDFRHAANARNIQDGQKCIMIVEVLNVSRGTGCVNVVCKELQSFLRVNVTWFSQPFRYKTCEMLYHETVAVAGTIKAGRGSYEFINPEIFSTDIDGSLGIYPVYSSIKGVKDYRFKAIVDNALELVSFEEPLCDDLIQKCGLVSQKEMVYKFHHPKSEQDLADANRKDVFNRLYNMADKMLRDASTINRKTTFIPRLLSTTNQLIKSLPYELTDDQKMVISEFVNQGKSGTRVNALIQGDVGCGKTVCAFLLMFAMADNGYQSVLMAPTGILARQHYEELSKYAVMFGKKAVFLDSSLKAKEKREVLALIKSGDADFVVGTHSVLSDKVEFHNLALTVVDEEHKFGVIQKEILKEKADAGVHSVSMSATPIPRSLALTLYDDAVDIYSISTMPGGRKKTKTAVVYDENVAFAFMNKEIMAGHQCYVVCPLIEDSDKSSSQSVDAVCDRANTFFQQYNPNVKIGVVTGKMKEEEKSGVISSFSNGDIDILIATTIIEVGVNVPNSTVMTIMDADRFGLAGLHQLRGRIGRGSFQGYCMLLTKQQNNPRLRAMCETTDGFKISEIDLQLRGTGDLLGSRQSGEDEDVALMISYPKLYSSLKSYIKSNRT